MSNGIAMAGLAQGLASAAKGIADLPERQARRDAAMAQAQLAEAQLADYNQGAGDRFREQQIRMEGLELQLKSQYRAAGQAATVAAVKQYMGDGDVKHWNNFLANAKENPVMAKMYGDTANVSPLTKSKETDEQLRAAGFANPDDIYNNPELAKGFLTINKMDGTNTVISVEQFAAGTGATKQLQDEELQKLEKSARIQQLLKSGNSPKTIALKEQVVQDLMKTKGMSLSEAYAAVNQMEKSGRGTGVLSSAEERGVKQIMEDQNVDFLTALGQYRSAGKTSRAPSEVEERIAKSIMAENPGMTEVDALKQAYQMTAPDRTTNFDKTLDILRNDPANAGKSDAELLSMAKNLDMTTKQKNVAAVDEVKAELDNIDFFDIDVAGMGLKDKAQLHKSISAIEEYNGVNRNSEERKTMRNLRSLVSLGTTVGDELRGDQVGILDNMLNSAKAYIVDDATNKEPKQAYETMRNIFRNTLFGASVTAGEEAAFNRAAGSPNQQLQPILSAVKVQMETVRDQLQTISDLDDPYLAHYYLGGDLADVDAAINRLNSRLGKFTAPKVQATQAAVPAQEPTVGGTSSFDLDAALDEAGL